MLEFLPEKVRKSIKKINEKLIYELRIRENQPITVNFNGKYVFLTEYGISEHSQDALLCDNADIQDIIFQAGNFSVYSIEEQLKQGFVTAKNGERIGIAGEYVLENGKTQAIRNFTSVCIRVPHIVINAGLEVYQRCLKDKLRNILICSAPGIGKTTILKDLIRILSENHQYNLLVCDERGEITNEYLGQTCDILKYTTKEIAFEIGIRTMRPDVIVTDEITKKDIEYIQKGIHAGVNVIATAHFDDVALLPQNYLGVFNGYVFLNKEKIGEVKELYSGNLKKVDSL